MSDKFLNDHVDFFEEEFLVALAVLDDEGKRQKKRYNPGCGCMTLTTVLTIAITVLIIFLIAL